jgi:hypothetical protein
MRSISARFDEIYSQFTVVLNKSDMACRWPYWALVALNEFADACPSDRKTGGVIPPERSAPAPTAIDSPDHFRVGWPGITAGKPVGIAHSRHAAANAGGLDAREWRGEQEDLPSRAEAIAPGWVKEGLCGLF